MKFKISIVLLSALMSTLIFKPASASSSQFQTMAANFPVGTQIFVDINNNSGIEDGTIDHPFNTIQEGINIAVSGDVVGVAPGTYYENVTLEAGVQLIGTERTTTIIDGNGSGRVVWMENASLLKGFTIQHGNAYSGAGIVTIGSPTITNNIIRNNSQSVDGAGATIYGENGSPVITKNLIIDNIANGFLNGAIGYVNFASPYIVNNVLTNNSGGGINISIVSGNHTVILNNTIIDNSGSGIKIDNRSSQTPILVVNNIITMNTIGLLVEFSSPTNLPLLYNNDVFGNSTNYSGISDFTGVNGNVAVEPLLLLGYHLSSDSPLIDAGNSLLFESSDFEGDQRTFDGNNDGIAVNDIGADEKTADDHIPPTISVIALKADNTSYTADTWTNQTVTVKFTCSDESGIYSCPPDQVISAEGITSPIVGTAIDHAGNGASISFGPIKIDKTPPALFIAVSPNPVLLNGNAELLINAADNLSGVRSGPCFNIDTSTVGFKSVTCIVEDNARNRTQTTSSYQVIYGFDGFQKPVIDCTNSICDNYNFSIINTGSSIALKFQLKDANGNLIRAASDPLWLVPTRFDGAPPFSLPNDYQFQVSNVPYEWKKNQEAYMYDWNTKGLPDQSFWLVGVRLDDGSTHYVFIKLEK